MNNEEAIRELEIRFVGEYAKQREAKDMGIKALKQKSNLDKIIAEIEEIETYDGIYVDRAYVLEIIYKYKANKE